MEHKRLLTPLVPTKVKNEEMVIKRRKQIVMAAIKLFTEKGFHQTTLRDLAEEAGISHGVIYDYVGTKEDILFLVHEHLVERGDELLSRCALNVKDPVERLHRMVRGEFRIVNEMADGILIMYQESHVLKDTPLMQRFIETEREHLARFEQVFEECVKQGKFRHVNPKIVANLVRTIVDSYVIKRWYLKGHVNRQDMERSIMQIILNGVLKENDCQGHPSAFPLRSIAF